jgi:hypothetical protein
MPGALTSFLKGTHLALITLGVLVLLMGAAGAVPLPFGVLPIRQPWNYGVVGLGVLCVATAVLLTRFEHRLGRNARAAASRSPMGQPIAISAYWRSHTPEFYVAAERLVGSARQVKFISMGLQILREGNILDILVSRARSGTVEVTAGMANPYNPDVLDRLTEEEMADTQPQIGRHGVERNIRSLLDRLDKEDNPANFRVCLFEHYPTLATYIIDQDVFVAPYTYRRIAHDAPLLHMRNDGHDNIARFFVDNAERMLRDAVPARDVFATHPDRPHFSETWLQACVSIIPDARDPLYQLGSSITGFDLRRGAKARTGPVEAADLADSIGEAAMHGFHAPLVDSLYFINEAAIGRVAAELSILAEDFPRFALVNLRVEDRSHTLGEVVLRCDDDSGVAEALHGELISRVYRRAVSSSYVGGRGLRLPIVGPVSSRSSLMIRRYGTPYVLRRWDLRFSLCAAPPADPDARKMLVELLQDAILEHIPAKPVDVEWIYLLVRAQGDSHWRIRNAYRLNGS